MTACLQFFSKLVKLSLPHLSFNDIFNVRTPFYFLTLCTPEPHQSLVLPLIQHSHLNNNIIISWVQLLTSRVYGAMEVGGAATPTLHRQAYRSLSMCMAAICEACPAQVLSTVQRFVSDIKVRFLLWSCMVSVSLFVVVCLFVVVVRMLVVLIQWRWWHSYHLERLGRPS